MIRDTSLAAYDELRVSLTRREQTVWTALVDCTAAPTAYELFARLRDKGQAFDLNSVRPRLNALLKKRCVETMGKRRCRVTGRTAYTWRARLGHPPIDKPVKAKAPAHRQPRLFDEERDGE